MPSPSCPWSLSSSEVKRQACAPVWDGKISAEDKILLGGLVGAAEVAGVSNEFIAVLKQIADSGEVVSLETVTAVREACA